MTIRPPEYKPRQEGHTPIWDGYSRPLPGWQRSLLRQHDLGELTRRLEAELRARHRFLPDSKSGQKTVILNAPALAVLNGLERIGPYVVPGVDPEQPRHDLKRPWDAVTKRAGVMGVRLHDLRHTYASFGAGGGLGLPIIGRLLGHSQPATTARYAHLDNDPLRRASEAIARQIATALEGKRTASVTALTKRRTA
jgi:integrase